MSKIGSLNLNNPIKSDTPVYETTMTLSSLSLTPAASVVFEKSFAEKPILLCIYVDDVEKNRLFSQLQVENLTADGFDIFAQAIASLEDGTCKVRTVFAGRF